MTETVTPALPYPVTSSGKRNWSWSAVHGVEEPSSIDTLPEMQGEDSGFATLLDIINPLQHIPVLNTLYRAATGDTISSPARILGDAVFGGPLGLLAGITNSVVAEISGQDVGEHLLASFSPDKSINSNGISVAQAAQEYEKTYDMG